MYQVIDTLTGWWNFNGLRPVSASIVKDVNTVSSGRRARADGSPARFLIRHPPHTTPTHTDTRTLRGEERERCRTCADAAPCPWPSRATGLPHCARMRAPTHAQQLADAVKLLNQRK